MTDGSASLYGQWGDVLGAFFAALGAPLAKPDGEADADGDAADPLKFVRQTLALTGGALPQIYGVWAALLQAGTAQSEGLHAIFKMQREALSAARKALTDTTAVRRQLEQLRSSLPAWAAPLFSGASPFALAPPNPLQIGAERSFGALADAFGLRPPRRIFEAWQILAEAEIERRLALADYLDVVAGALEEGVDELLHRLERMAEDGKQVDSFVGLLRLWARSTDTAMHEAMQSERGLEATAKLLRASTHRREELQRLVALTSEALNVPTRAEVDAAYREIQQLKREVRRLRKGDAARGRERSEPTRAAPAESRQEAASPPAEDAEMAAPPAAKGGRSRGAKAKEIGA